MRLGHTISDRIRQGFFSCVFIAFAIYTVKYHDYIPSPKELHEAAVKKWAAVNLDSELFCDGDLILRHGKGFISDAMLAFSTNDPQYSHSGMIRKENGRIWVYHAIGGEENESNKMRREPIEIFCHPQAVYKFGVYRYDLSEAQIAVYDSLMMAYYQQGMEFDLDFDMYSEEKMYCSEMIYKALIFATNDKNFIHLSRVIDKPYVAIDDLYLNPHCKPIFHYDYD